MNRIIIPNFLTEKAKAHLFQGYGEHFLFFLCFIEDKDGLIFNAQDVILIEDKDLAQSEDLALEIQLPVLIGIMNKANRDGLALVEAHNHSSRYRIGFSSTDIRGFAEFVPYVLGTLGRPYGATVWHPKGVVAVCWTTKSTRAVKMEVRITPQKVKTNHKKRGGPNERFG